MLYPSHVPMRDLEYPEEENSQPLQRLNQAEFSEQGEERLREKGQRLSTLRLFSEGSVWEP